MTRMNPLVTVIMPVHNGGRYLPTAIESILKQSEASLELLVVDDGSTDDSREIVGHNTDRRVRLLENQEQQGISYSLNRGIEEARGGFVARMDSDDISVSVRLEKQIAFLSANPAVGICGTGVATFNLRTSNISPPETHEEIMTALIFGNVMIHPSVMMRRSLFTEKRLRYDCGSAFKHAEDYEFWVRASEVTRLANLPDNLLRYRLHDSQITARKIARQADSALRAQEVLLARLGLRLNEEEQEAQRVLSALPAHFPSGKLEQVESWLKKISQANTLQPLLDEELLSTELGRRWTAACLSARPLRTRMLMRPLFSSRAPAGWRLFRAILSRLAEKIRVTFRAVSNRP